MNRKCVGVVAISVLILSTLLAQDAKFAADNLKYSRDFYSKVHFVAIANLSFGSAGTAEFKYDRYPNGGPERIQTGDGEFARKDGKTWLRSNDWGETGKPVDAQTSKRLNNWVGLIDARLNGEPTSNDPSEGATVMKFLGKKDEGEREEFVFEESKEKPKGSSYPHISFGRYKNAKSEQVLLSHFSGPMRLGAREAKVDISFSYLIAVKIQETVHESPSPALSPAAEESDSSLVNGGIEKAKNGDLDGALADFNRAIELDPKDDAAYYNRAQAKRLKKDAGGAIADYTRAIELGSKNPAAYNNRGNARAENNDRDGAIADYTRAIELKPDYARAYYNRAVTKQAKGDATGADADFKTAEKLDPELASEKSAADSKNNRPSGVTTVSLLDGKLKLDIPSDFSRDPDDPKNPKTVAKFSGPDGAWGEVLRGTHGLTPEKLEGYLKMRVQEYSKGFKWLPKDSHLQWLKKEIVTIDGRKWADWRYVPMLKRKKDYSHNPVYTRFLTASYKGQLLEINFTSNLNTETGVKGRDRPHHGLGALGRMNSKLQSGNWKIFVGIVACAISCVFSSAQESPRPEENRSSLSPDKKWEYKLVDGNRPAIIETGTTKIVLDLSTLDVPNPDATEVVWAPDSKRFAFNYQSGTRYQTTTLYQLDGDKWQELDSPESDVTTAALDRSMAAQKKKLKLSPRKQGRPIMTSYQIRKWIDSSTALLYAHSEESFQIRNETVSPGASFFFTLKFNPAGNWKIVRTREVRANVGLNNVEREEIKRIEKEEGEETSTIGDHIYHHQPEH